VAEPLEEGEHLPSRLGLFIPRERAPDTSFIGVWVGSRADLDAGEKRKVSCPCQELNCVSLYRLSHPGSKEAQPETRIQYFANYVRLLIVLEQYYFHRIVVGSTDDAKTSLRLKMKTLCSRCDTHNRTLNFREHEVLVFSYVPVKSSHNGRQMTKILKIIYF
jgi:hypothetical protein